MRGGSPLVNSDPVEGSERVNILLTGKHQLNWRTVFQCRIDNTHRLTLRSHTSIVMSGTDFCSCDELDFLLRRDSKCMKYECKATSCLLLDKTEGFDTIFKGYAACYTNYSSYGLLAASLWLRPAWCSAAYCVCGVPLSVADAPPKWSLTAHVNSVSNKIAPSKPARCLPSSKIVPEIRPA